MNSKHLFLLPRRASDPLDASIWPVAMHVQEQNEHYRDRYYFKCSQSILIRWKEAVPIVQIVASYWCPMLACCAMRLTIFEPVMKKSVNSGWVLEPAFGPADLSSSRLEHVALMELNWSCMLEGAKCKYCIRCLIVQHTVGRSLKDCTEKKYPMFSSINKTTKLARNPF